MKAEGDQKSNMLIYRMVGKESIYEHGYTHHSGGVNT